MMLDFMYQPMLLAQQQASFSDQLLKVAYILGIIAAVFVRREP